MQGYWVWVTDPPIHKHMWCQLQKNFVFTHRRMERKALWAVVFGRTSRQQLNFVSALWHFDHTIVYWLLNKQYIRGSMTNNKRMIVTGMIKLLSSVWICVYSVYFGWFSDSQYASMCLYIINMLHMFILVLIGVKKMRKLFCLERWILSILTTTAVNTWVSHQLIIWKFVSI